MRAARTAPSVVVTPGSARAGADGAAGRRSAPDGRRWPARGPGARRWAGRPRRGPASTLRRPRPPPRADEDACSGSSPSAGTSRSASNEVQLAAVGVALYVQQAQDGRLAVGQPIGQQDHAGAGASMSARPARHGRDRLAGRRIDRSAAAWRSTRRRAGSGHRARRGRPAAAPAPARRRSRGSPRHARTAACRASADAARRGGGARVGGRGRRRCAIGLSVGATSPNGRRSSTGISFRSSLASAHPGRRSPRPGSRGCRYWAVAITIARATRAGSSALAMPDLGRLRPSWRQAGIGRGRNAAG